MNELDRKPLNLSILNTIIETTIKSNASSGLNRNLQQKRQLPQNNSLGDFSTRSYRNHNITLNNININNEKSFNSFPTAFSPTQPYTAHNEDTNTIEEKKKQKFKFKMKLFRGNTSFVDCVPCLCLWFLLVSISAIYFGLVWPRLMEIFNKNSYWIIFLVVKVYFFFNLVINFLLSIFRDPGHFPKEIINSNNDVKNELIVHVKGEPVEIKWCTV